MIKEEKKINEFLEDLWKISKKHGIWIALNPNYGAEIYDDQADYLGTLWAKQDCNGPLCIEKYDWRPDDT